jgi:hypothetical protein
MHYLSSIYFVIQPLHVSGMFIANSLYTYSNLYMLYVWVNLHDHQPVNLNV